MGRKKNVAIDDGGYSFPNVDATPAADSAPPPEKKGQKGCKGALGGGPMSSFSALGDGDEEQDEDEPAAEPKHANDPGAGEDDRDLNLSEAKKNKDMGTRPSPRLDLEEKEEEPSATTIAGNLQKKNRAKVRFAWPLAEIWGQPPPAEEPKPEVAMDEASVAAAASMDDAVGKKSKKKTKKTGRKGNKIGPEFGEAYHPEKGEDKKPEAKEDGKEGLEAAEDGNAEEKVGAKEKKEKEAGAKEKKAAARKKEEKMAAAKEAEAKEQASKGKVIMKELPKHVREVQDAPVEEDSTAPVEEDSTKKGSDLRGPGELRAKGAYLHHKEIIAAHGVKISAQGLEHANAGTGLYVLGPDDSVDKQKHVVMEDLKVAEDEASMSAAAMVEESEKSEPDQEMNVIEDIEDEHDEIGIFANVNARDLKRMLKLIGKKHGGLEELQKKANKELPLETLKKKDLVMLCQKNNMRQHNWSIPKMISKLTALKKSLLIKKKKEREFEKTIEDEKTLEEKLRKEQCEKQTYLNLYQDLNKEVKKLQEVNMNFGKEKKKQLSNSRGLSNGINMKLEEAKETLKSILEQKKAEDEQLRCLREELKKIEQQNSRTFLQQTPFSRSCCHGRSGAYASMV